MWGGCVREQKHALSRAEVVGATVRDNALLGLTAEQVQGLFGEALVGSGHFLPPSSEGTIALSLDLPFTRESSKHGRDGTWAEVGAELTIRRRDEKVKVRYEVMGLGEERIAGEDDRRRAMQTALRRALQQAVTSAHLQLRAVDRTDVELERDLRSGEPEVREFALRVLSERGNPVVAEVLIERLRAEDVEQVRQAMGALSEMREVRAVKPLIDLTRGKDPLFVREVVFALAQIGGEEAMAYLYTVAQGHDEPVLRESAQQALHEIEQRRQSAAQDQENQP